jgi:hypothetical protein
VAATAGMIVNGGFLVCDNDADFNIKITPSIGGGVNHLCGGAILIIVTQDYVLIIIVVW